MLIGTTWKSQVRPVFLTYNPKTIIKRIYNQTLINNLDCGLILNILLDEWTMEYILEVQKLIGYAIQINVQMCFQSNKCQKEGQNT